MIPPTSGATQQAPADNLFTNESVELGRRLL